MNPDGQRIVNGKHDKPGNQSDCLLSERIQRKLEHGKQNYQSQRRRAILTSRASARRVMALTRSPPARSIAASTFAVFAIIPRGGCTIPLMSFEDDEASCVARIAQVRAHEFPEAAARCVAPALACNPTREQSCWRGRLQEGATTMAARATHGKTKRLPSASRKPSREGAAKLARRLAEVQALRKLVQKAEAGRHLLIAYAACLIRKSSIRLPDFNCAASQRGFLPRPAQVSDGRSGFRYFGTTAG